MTLSPLPSWTRTVPAVLRDRPQWVAWRWEQVNGKRTKVPMMVQAVNRKASSTDRATWCSFPEAVAALGNGRQLDGVGFVVTDDDPFVGVDLDHCRDSETGLLLPWAQQLVDRLASYTEITPSSEGVRVYIRGILPPGGRKRGPIEMYETARYFTITGRHLPDTPFSIEERTDLLATIHAETFGPIREDTLLGTVPGPPLDLDDAELIARARNATNGAMFSRLWAGDWSGYGSQSDADMALANYLAFWTSGDTLRMDHLFRDSGLYREKWNEVHYGTGETYGSHTLAKSMEGRTQFYRTPSTWEMPTNGTAPPDDGDDATTETDELPAGEFALTDLGNAHRLVAAWGLALHYCYPWGKWLTWTGKRWHLDDTGQVYRWAKTTVRGIYAEAASAGDDTRSAALSKHAARSQAEARIKAMVSLAESELPVPVLPDQLDAHPWLFACHNGVLDLRTGWLREHARDDLITRVTTVRYDPEATCPRWLAFLEQVMGGDTELISFLQRAVGYSLTGLTSERALFFLHGTGANGKSTFLEALRLVFGEYAMRTPAETLVARAEGAIPNDVARLKGARLVAASETEEGKRLAEALVKALTGGDTISARFMRSEWFDFRPEFKLWLATNHKPVIRGTDRGIWDRIRLIPFEVSIPDAEQDKQLGVKLAAELPGILAWAVAGCLAWQREGLAAPDAVANATEFYREEMDVLAHWLDECCVIEPSASVTGKSLYSSYQGWCERAGERTLSQRWLGSRMTERGFMREQIGHGKVWTWRGIRVISGDVV